MAVTSSSTSGTLCRLLRGRSGIGDSASQTSRISWSEFFRFAFRLRGGGRTRRSAPEEENETERSSPRRRIIFTLRKILEMNLSAGTRRTPQEVLPCQRKCRLSSSRAFPPCRQRRCRSDGNATRTGTPPQPLCCSQRFQSFSVSLPRICGAGKSCAPVLGARRSGGEEERFASGVSSCVMGCSREFRPLPPGRKRLSGPSLTHLDGGNLPRAILSIIRKSVIPESGHAPLVSRLFSRPQEAERQLISVASRPDRRKIFIGGSMLVFLQYCSNFHRSHGDAAVRIDVPRLSVAGSSVQAAAWERRFSRRSKPPPLDGPEDERPLYGRVGEACTEIPGNVAARGRIRMQIRVLSRRRGSGRGGGLNKHRGKLRSSGKSRAFSPDLSPFGCQLSQIRRCRGG